ncbi:hypothetical protein EVAR_97121_1 [Eumeta japonica]|uniref:Uncharacterized protein n=1 Tax=Eumeta variegata TaxID=151549 RepID=A0A4C1WSM6_EUMVA|nr:hypothetical protein EVAR_97121_1 [Eumeta japonica]
MKFPDHGNADAYRLAVVNETGHVTRRFIVRLEVAAGGGARLDFGTKLLVSHETKQSPSWGRSLKFFYVTARRLAYPF